MIYTLQPGSTIPKFKMGDTAVIMGKCFPYRGSVATKKQIPPLSIGIYLCTDTMQYCLHHVKKDDPEIITAYNMHIITSISEDKTPVTREKQFKEIFTIPITPEDNYLKVLVKRALQTLKIDIADYRHKFNNENHYNNTKRSLISESTLSYEKFCEILYILDLKHTIQIYDADNKPFIFEDEITQPK